MCKLDPVVFMVRSIAVTLMCVCVVCSMVLSSESLGRILPGGLASLPTACANAEMSRMSCPPSEQLP